MNARKAALRAMDSRSWCIKERMIAEGGDGSLDVICMDGGFGCLVSTVGKNTIDKMRSNVAMVTRLECFLLISTLGWMGDRLMGWMVIAKSACQVLSGQHVEMFGDREHLGLIM